MGRGRVLGGPAAGPDFRHSFLSFLSSHPFINKIDQLSLTLINRFEYGRVKLKIA